MNAFLEHEKVSSPTVCKVSILINEKDHAVLADFGISVIDHVGSSLTKPQRDGVVAWKAPEMLGDPDADFPLSRERMPKVTSIPLDVSVLRYLLDNFCLASLMP